MLQGTPGRFHSAATREISVDPILLTIVTRMFERILVVGAGALAIYLGYRLFVNMPEHDKGSGKVVLPGGISIFLSRVGPGVFFSLFGAVILGLSFHYGIKYDNGNEQSWVGSPVVYESFSGIAPSASAADPVDALRERNAALVAIGALNRAAAELRADLPAYERRQIM